MPKPSTRLTLDSRVYPTEAKLKIFDSSSKNFKNNSRILSLKKKGLNFSLFGNFGSEDQQLHGTQLNWQQELQELLFMEQKKICSN